MPVDRTPLPVEPLPPLTVHHEPISVDVRPSPLPVTPNPLPVSFGALPSLADSIRTPGSQVEDTGTGLDLSTLQEIATNTKDTALGVQDVHVILDKRLPETAA